MKSAVDSLGPGLGSVFQKSLDFLLLTIYPPNKAIGIPINIIKKKDKHNQPKKSFFSFSKIDGASFVSSKKSLYQSILIILKII